MLITALAVLLVLEVLAENLPILKEMRLLRLIMGALLATASVGYALWAGAKVLEWDFPTRLAISGCLFPILTALEHKIPRYKRGLRWTAVALYVILLVLTAIK